MQISGKLNKQDMTNYMNCKVTEKYYARFSWCFLIGNSKGFLYIFNKNAWVLVKLYKLTSF